MNLKKILFGEKVPDRDDPNYKKLREESEIAGRKAAEITGLGKILAKVQHFAENYPKVFWGIIIVYVLWCLSLSLYRLNYALTHRPRQSTAVERVEKELGFKHLAQPEDAEVEGNDNDHLNQ